MCSKTIAKNLHLNIFRVIEFLIACLFQVANILVPSND